MVFGHGERVGFEIRGDFLGGSTIRELEGSDHEDLMRDEAEELMRITGQLDLGDGRESGGFVSREGFFEDGEDVLFVAGLDDVGDESLIHFPAQERELVDGRSESPLVGADVA